MIFKLDEMQEKKLAEWKKEQNKKVSDMQDEIEAAALALAEAGFEDCNIPSCRMKGEAYYGVCGGGYSYVFTPNSLGMGISVSNTITGEEIDLTDYENW
jgi:hypothetical protein